jgi:hypothetical protein
MHVLRVEHSVADYGRWKKAFDDDPIGRKKSGVLAYRILRAADDPNLVMIDLEFDSAEEAERMRESLRELWGRVDVMRDPRARSAEVVEHEDYR